MIKLKTEITNFPESIIYVMDFKNNIIFKIPYIDEKNITELRKIFKLELKKLNMTRKNIDMSGIHFWKSYKNF